MSNKQKIDEYGKLLPDSKIENSSFFNLLIKNNNEDIDNWLLNNGKLKPYCTVRFISDNTISINNEVM